MFKIRFATKYDKNFWFTLDHHISEAEFELKARDQRGYVICDDNISVGIMRYNLFWDNTPFLTLIYLKDDYRNIGFGKQALAYWENQMTELGYKMVMTSTQIDEEAQHFYRKFGYLDKGSLSFDDTPFEQPLELLMIKVL